MLWSVNDDIKLLSDAECGIPRAGGMNRVYITADGKTGIGDTTGSHTGCGRYGSNWNRRKSILRNQLPEQLRVFQVIMLQYHTLQDILWTNAGYYQLKLMQAVMHGLELV